MEISDVPHTCQCQKSSRVRLHIACILIVNLKLGFHRSLKLLLFSCSRRLTHVHIRIFFFAATLMCGFSSQLHYNPPCFFPSFLPLFLPSFLSSTPTSNLAHSTLHHTTLHQNTSYQSYMKQADQVSSNEKRQTPEQSQNKLKSNQIKPSQAERPSTTFSRPDFSSAMHF